MSVLSYFSRHLFVPLYHELRGFGDINTRLAEWQETFRLPYEQVRKLERERLGAVLRAAYNGTEYYREIIDKAGVAYSLDDANVLSALPVLDKPLIRANPQGFINRNVPEDQIIRTMTGGSTSDPLVFYRDKSAYCSRWGLQAAANSLLGWNPGDWYGLVWGASQDLPTTNSPKHALLNNLVHRCLPLNASRLTWESAKIFLEQIQKLRPQIIYGYPVMLELLAMEIRQRGIEVHSPRYVVVTAEKLSLRARETIEEVFGCPVIDRYASREFGIIADQCLDSDYLRVVPASVKIEVLPISPEDPSIGELVITDLLNVGMPFIRYRTGDVGRVTETTVNGVEGFYLSEITGRTTDLIISPTGRVISGTAALPLFREFPGIDQAQIHQLEPDKFRILVVRGEAYTMEAEEGMRKTLSKYCDAPVSVEIEYVDSIPRDKSGKFRVVISQVAPKIFDGEKTFSL